MMTETRIIGGIDVITGRVGGTGGGGGQQQVWIDGPLADVPALKPTATSRHPRHQRIRFTTAAATTGGNSDDGHHHQHHRKHRSGTKQQRENSTGSGAGVVLNTSWITASTRYNRALAASQELPRRVHTSVYRKYRLRSKAGRAVATATSPKAQKHHGGVKRPHGGHRHRSKMGNYLGNASDEPPMRSILKYHSQRGRSGHHGRNRGITDNVWLRRPASVDLSAIDRVCKDIVMSMSNEHQRHSAWSDDDSSSSSDDDNSSLSPAAADSSMSGVSDADGGGYSDVECERRCDTAAALTSRPHISPPECRIPRASRTQQQPPPPSSSESSDDDDDDTLTSFTHSRAGSSTHSGDGEPAMPPSMSHQHRTVTSTHHGCRCRVARHQLKLKAYINAPGILTVHIMRARLAERRPRQKRQSGGDSNKLTSADDSCHNSYVKVSISPDWDQSRTLVTTPVIHQAHEPSYDHKFSLELLHKDVDKRLLISLWNREGSAVLSDQQSNGSESTLLGCMSFGIRHLLQQTKRIDGWYYLLAEKYGRRKHQPVLAKSDALKPNNNKNNKKNASGHGGSGASSLGETILQVRHTVV